VPTALVDEDGVYSQTKRVRVRRANVALTVSTHLRKFKDTACLNPHDFYEKVAYKFLEEQFPKVHASQHYTIAQLAIGVLHRSEQVDYLVERPTYAKHTY
jgi:hypothetical protein